jgi:hypothetical protein
MFRRNTGYVGRADLNILPFQFLTFTVLKDERCAVALLVYMDTKVVNTIHEH